MSGTCVVCSQPLERERWLVARETCGVCASVDYARLARQLVLQARDPMRMLLSSECRAAAKLCEAMPEVEAFLDAWRADGGCDLAGCESARPGLGDCRLCKAYQRLREALQS